MAEHEKSLVKSSNALTRFDPKARKELVVRALNAITEVKDADFYFFKGEEHRMQGQLKKAIKNYEKALQINSEHEDSLFWMGFCYAPDAEGRTADDIELDNTIRHERSGAAFQKLIKIREKKDSIWWDSYVVYYNLSLAQYSLGLYEEAIESCEQAIELNPDHANSYYILGLSQYHLLLYEEAAESFEQATELNPDHADSYYMLGISQEQLGIYHLALENFDKYVSLADHKIPETLERVEYARNRIEQLKDSLTYSYFYNIGFKFWKKDQYRDAIACYERAIELNPDFPDVYYNLAIAQEKMADTTYSQPVLFEESDWKKSIHELHRMALDNFEKYLRIEDHKVAENEQFITYANQRVDQLKEMLEKIDTE